MGDTGLVSSLRHKPEFLHAQSKNFYVQELVFDCIDNLVNKTTMGDTGLEPVTPTMSR